MISLQYQAGGKRAQLGRATSGARVATTAAEPQRLNLPRKNEKRDHDTTLTIVALERNDALRLLHRSFSALPYHRT